MDYIAYRAYYKSEDNHFVSTASIDDVMEANWEESPEKDAAAIASFVEQEERMKGSLWLVFRYKWIPTTEECSPYCHSDTIYATEPMEEVIKERWVTLL